MTPQQMYQLRQLAQGPVPYEIFRKWDQRPLAGLYKRGAFRLSVKSMTAELSQLGWDLYKSTTHGKFRKDPTRPLFLRGQGIMGTRTATRTTRTKAV